jgi:hypothetical protein
MVSDVATQWPATRDRAVVGTGSEPVAAAYRPISDVARPGLLALLLS